MPESICCITGCARPVHNREHSWCKAHYLRWYRYGSPTGGRGSVKPTLVAVACAVEGCERRSSSKGLCDPHYQRLGRLGDPGPAEVEQRRKDATCSVDGCERRYYGLGLCNMHWQRNHKYGSPDTVLSAWRDDVGYNAAHERLRRCRGSASQFDCVHCDGQAADWAYDGMCADERTGMREGRMLRYSVDMARYMPLCKRCHSAYDNNYPKRRTG